MPSIVGEILFIYLFICLVIQINPSVPCAKKWFVYKKRSWIKYPIRNLSSWQRWEWLEIVDYGLSCLEMPMKQENLELVIVDYPPNFLYWKLNYKQRWSSSAFPIYNTQKIHMENRMVKFFTTISGKNTLKPDYAVIHNLRSLIDFSEKILKCPFLDSRERCSKVSFIS